MFGVDCVGQPPPVLHPHFAPCILIPVLIKNNTLWSMTLGITERQDLNFLR